MKKRKQFARAGGGPIHEKNWLKGIKKTAMGGCVKKEEEQKEGGGEQRLKRKNLVLSSFRVSIIKKGRAKESCKQRIG